ncbi:MAG: UDP-N-acetylmuramoyl-tripeptide--D-alanyl-D-alanine ligase [Spirochaetales bacterium]|nr:UDP-N-acetylmuramoyl-tripeptide--D-alanyl-D-alanine ligase [Spirochaetales bacterium]
MDEHHGACSATWFADAAGGELANGPDAVFERVETDSRAVGPGSLFVALRGERNDGHDFVRIATDAGAAALVSASWWLGQRQGSSFGSDATVIVVPDTLPALQRAAAQWRRRFPSLLRFGVTGSAGKTSTKELLAAIMGAARPTIKNPGNRNSDIGLPASLFLVRPWHEAAVFEMGINHPGEMDTLAGVYEPDCAVVTNIGSAHIGVLGGSRAAIAEEKKRIASRFNGSQSLVVWEEDDFRDVLVSGVAGRCVTYGPRSTDGFEGARDLGVDGWELRYHGIEVRLRLPGAHNLRNALAAISAAALYDATPENVATGLEAVLPLSGRTSVHHGAFTVVDDCYNANEESMNAAIGFCDSVAVPGKKLYVIGSMGELGAESEPAHRRVGALAAASGASVLAFFGEDARAAYDAALGVLRGSSNGVDVRYYESYDDLERDVVPMAQPGDLVLVKASRSMALERLTERLTGQKQENGGNRVS